MESGSVSQVSRRSVLQQSFGCGYVLPASRFSCSCARVLKIVSKALRPTRYYGETAHG